MNMSALLQQAVAAHQAGNFELAENLYRQLLAAHPGHPQITYLLGALRAGQGRSAEALVLLQSAHEARRGDPVILLHLGNVLQDMKRYEEALERYDQALALRPAYDEAHNNKGNALRTLKRFDNAIASFDAAVALSPQNPNFWYNRAIPLHETGRFEEALKSYHQALSLQPDHAEALNNKGRILRDLGQNAQALAAYDRAVAIQPANPEFRMNRATLLADMHRFEDALLDHDRILADHPEYPNAYGEAANDVLHLCDWARRAHITAEMPARMEAGAAVNPWIALNYSDDGALLRRAAENTIRGAAPDRSPALWSGGDYRHKRIRIAYISADFHAHPVGFQLVEVLERHDRSRFEIIGLSAGADEDSDIRRRIIAAFDQFHDVQRRNGLAVARLLRDLEVDIAIDLGGYTHGSIFGALAHRPCPVQATWLGYPGTTGADFIDYIIADPVVAPMAAQPFYSEQIMHLPDTYFPTDTQRAIGRPPSRAEMGLPEAGFVFCCFNNNFKITRPVFGIWMRLLQQVPGSVLWLRGYKPDVLRREAATHAIAPGRLVFAEHVPLDVHHARYQLADLFLDTHPYNAHATAAEALWAGLPVLTRLGASFPGRVAASLLTAAGLPELITHSPEEYESIALALARDPPRLKSLREKLAGNRATAPLFDTGRFTRNLETAFETMLGEKT